jgi:hypothetical protein
MTAREYVAEVVRGTLKDPTLSFQLKHGFRVFDVVSGYLRHDPESGGYAALIEWLSPQLGKEAASDWVHATSENHFAGLIPPHSWDYRPSFRN